MMPDKGKVSGKKRNAAAGQTTARKSSVSAVVVSPAAGHLNVQVGSVTVSVRAPTASELKKRVSESKMVATRLRKAIAKPGVRLTVKSTTPVYTADRRDPQFVIQKLGNKSTRGTFKNGVFVEVA